MQSLNSVGDTRRALVATGIGMFIAFLFLAPLAVSASTTSVKVTTDKTSYSGTATIHVSGNVTSAPGVSGTNVAVTVSGPAGSPNPVDANQFLVNANTGAFNGTFITGGPNYAINGTYTITANYGGVTGTANFQYGSVGTSTSKNNSGVTTTIFASTTTTVVQAGATTTVVQQGATTTVVQQQQTTITQAVTTAMTVTESATATTDSTALAVGALGVIIAIIAIVLSVLTMRRRKI